MDELRARDGDSSAAPVPWRRAIGMPVGPGEPLFDKLDADIAYAMMGIKRGQGRRSAPAFASVTQRGTSIR